MSEFEKTEALWDTENGMENRKENHTEVQAEEVTEEVQDDFDIPDIPSVFPTPEQVTQDTTSGQKEGTQPGVEAHVWNSKTTKQQVKEAKKKYRDEKKRLRREKRMRGPGWKKVLVTGLICALIGGFVGSLLTISVLTVTSQAFHIDLLDLKPEQIEVIREQYVARIQEYKSPGTAVYKKNNNSVVGIKTNGGSTSDSLWESQTEDVGIASGVIYRADGYILTNIGAIRNVLQSNGTLQENATIEVYLPQKENASYSASIVGYDWETDVALLHVEETNLYAVEIGDSAQIQQGETVFAMAYVDMPGNLSIKESIISTLQSEILKIDKSAEREWCNSPLFSAEGQLVGMNSTSTDEEGTFAVPVNRIVQVCDRMLEENQK